jgi:hypothetical protein
VQHYLTWIGLNRKWDWWIHSFIKNKEKKVSAYDQIKIIAQGIEEEKNALCSLRSQKEPVASSVS